VKFELTKYQTIRILNKKNRKVINLETVQNLDEVIVEFFGRKHRKSGLGEFLFGRNDDRPEAVELGSIREKMLEVGKGQGPVKAVAVGSGPANVPEFRAQALHFLQVDGVARELLQGEKPNKDYLFMLYKSKN
jgi:hypothetical protein